MTTITKAELPITHEDACGTHALLEMLQRHKGVVAADLDTRTDKLVLEYDPDLIGLKQVQRIAAEIGITMREHYEECHLEINRVCAGCDVLEKRLRAMPGVAYASANTYAGSLRVEYAPAQVAPTQLEKAVIDLGYQVRPDEEEAAAPGLPRFLQPDLVAPIFVAINLLTLIGGVIAERLGAPGWSVTVLAATSFITGGAFGLIEAVRELRHFTLNVDLLMILAALGAAATGAWPEGAMLLFLFSLSNVLQNFALDRSRNAIRKLMDLRPATALVMRDGEAVEVPVEQLKLGEVVIIKPGDNIPVDGRVARGQSAVNQASITGESIPVEKRPGDSVFAGTVNEHGSLEVEVTQEASDTTLAKIIQLVEEAQSRRARTQRFLDKFEQYYAMAVIGSVILFIGISTLLFNRPFDQTFYRGMVLLVVASPCALVISTPASILSAIANAARNGVLFKGGVHLENAASIKVVAFDKTGTLTYGRPRVTDVVAREGLAEDELLRLAASAESRSEHPLAQAVVRAADERGLELIAPSEFQAYPGMGIRAELNGESLLIGSPKLLAQEGLTVQPEMQELLDRLESEGKTVLLVHNDVCMGAIAVADELRESAADTIADLKRAGVERVVMLTGDNERVAAAVSERVGVDEFYASLLPDGKVEAIKELEAKYGPVAMVGDGVNDAPALATATLGVAMGGAGTDVALETADVVLMADSIARLPYVIRLSKQTNRIVWQNISFALAVIVVLIVSTFLIKLPLPLGVVGHEGSTVIVVFNGLRLLAFRP